MLKTILLTLGVACALPATAQDKVALIPVAPIRNNEVGLFSNAVISTSANNTLIMAGVHYKHWVKPNTAYRTLVSFARYSMYDESPSSKAANNDTVYSVFSNTNVNMAFVGAGVEMQRHFYKRVYLFAALELRGGTGGGKTEDYETSKYKEPGGTYYNTSDTRPLGIKNVSMTYVGFVPSIGGKLQFNRVSFGAELCPMEMSYKSATMSGSRNGLLDFNLGVFSNRFFFNFRF